MQQKVIYRHYSLIGISLIIGFSACEEQTDYRVRADWTYINESSNTIELPYREGSSIVSIAPMDTFIINQDSEGPENVTRESYNPPLNGIPTRYGADQCLTYGADEGPFKTDNYESKELEERYYEFTYRFTDEEFAQAKDCQ